MLNIYFLQKAQIFVQKLNLYLLWTLVAQFMGFLSELWFAAQMKVPKKRPLLWCPKDWGLCVQIRDPVLYFEKRQFTQCTTFVFPKSDILWHSQSGKSGCVGTRIDPSWSTFFAEAGQIDSRIYNSFPSSLEKCPKSCTFLQYQRIKRCSRTFCGDVQVEENGSIKMSNADFWSSNQITTSLPDKEDPQR